MPATLSRPTSLRRPRFRRVETPPPFQLTARDLAILHAVARFRFLSSTLIIRLVGGSSQQILRRLQLLFHHGYLDRPTSQVAQLAHAFDFGNRPFIYGLGRAGAHVLAEAGIPLKEKLDWTTKNARATAQFLAHTIETAETMIAFELACRAEGAPTLDRSSRSSSLSPRRDARRRCALPRARHAQNGARCAHHRRHSRSYV